MRLTKLVSKTLRTDPAEAETVSHRLMLKSGMVSQVTAGVYSYLPLAWRALRKVENIIREEVDAAGGPRVAATRVAADGAVGADRSQVGLRR